MYCKILITGGAGYIGSHLVDKIKSDFGNKVDVVIVDNLVNSYAPKLKNVVFENVDINKKDLLETVFRKYEFDFVFHLAALADARESMVIPFDYFKTNVGGTMNILDLVKKYKIKNFCFTSSCSVYGNSDGLITEDVDANPISVYGQTKLICEKIIEKFSNEFKINSTVFRLFNVAGASGKKMIGELSKKSTRIMTNACLAVINNKKFEIYGNTYSTKDGTCGRDYVHVDDVADLFALLLKKDKIHDNYFEIFNVGSGNLITNLEIVREIEKVSGKKIEINFNEGSRADPESVVSSRKKVSAYYRWNPSRSSLNVITKTSWNWFSRKSI